MVNESCPFGQISTSHREAIQMLFSSLRVRLAEMYRRGHFVEKDQQNALEYAYLAVYQQESQLNGRYCWEMCMNYHESLPKFKDEKPSTQLNGPESEQDRDASFDLAIYWYGRVLEAKGCNLQPCIWRNYLGYDCHVQCI